MDKYLEQLKNFKVQDPNFKDLEEKIVTKTQKRNVMPRLALVSGLAAIFIVAGIYFYSSSLNQNDSLMAYVLDQDNNSNQDPILDFIFEE